MGRQGADRNGCTPQGGCGRTPDLPQPGKRQYAALSSMSAVKPPILAHPSGRRPSGHGAGPAATLRPIRERRVRAEGSRQRGEPRSGKFCPLTRRKAKEMRQSAVRIGSVPEGSRPRVPRDTLLRRPARFSPRAARLSRRVIRQAGAVAAGAAEGLGREPRAIRVMKSCSACFAAIIGGVPGYHSAIRPSTIIRASP